MLALLEPEDVDTAELLDPLVPDEPELLVVLEEAVDPLDAAELELDPLDGLVLLLLPHADNAKRPGKSPTQRRET